MTSSWRVWAAGALLLATVATNAALGQELILAEGSEFPGRLFSVSGGGERQLFRRPDRADPAYPRAVMRLNQAAVDVEGKLFYVSGLDGYVMHLLDGRHEIQVFEHPGQVRDIACSSEPHVIYFSVVPTPQSGERLADGKIFRRDLWLGTATEVATIRQGDVGHAWWGSFAIQGNDIYLATVGAPSRLFKLQSGAAVPVFEGNTLAIRGFSGEAGGSFVVATGSDKIYRTRDFRTLEPAHRASRNLTDVSSRPSAAGFRP